MAKLAFVGLGLMGTPMATRLLEAGHDLSPIGSTVRAKRANGESGTWPPNFKLTLALKDLRLVNDIADRAGRRLGVASASRDWLEQAAEAGAGDLDFSAVIATITAGAGSGAP